MRVGDDTRDLDLNPDTVGGFLRQHGYEAENTSVEVQTLGGGVSNTVLLARSDQACVVLKQPLPNLDVNEDWPADVTRVHNEAAAARAYRTILNTANHQIRVPRVEFEDESRHVIGIECAPESAEMWKTELLEGYVDTDIASTVGQALGLVHVHAADDAALRAEFESQRPFRQLRIDPYHRTVAQRHPDVADIIEAEIDRILSVDRTLVHGDYSPKNVLVNRLDGSSEPWILDFEVAHWGDPAFDTAFMLNHLFIKSVYNHENHEDYIEAIRLFWDGYSSICDWDIEHETVTELGILMLARVDGKSPVEYVEDSSTAESLRMIAKSTLDRNLTTIDEVVERTAEEVSS